MIVWEGDQKHLPPLIIQTREERGVECNRPAGLECDRKLTAAGLECCRRSNDAHGRRLGVLSTIGDRMMIMAAGGEFRGRTDDDGDDDHGHRPGVLSTTE